MKRHHLVVRPEGDANQLKKIQVSGAEAWSTSSDFLRILARSSQGGGARAARRAATALEVCASRCGDRIRPRLGVQRFFRRRGAYILGTPLAAAPGRVVLWKPDARTGLKPHNHRPQPFVSHLYSRTDGDYVGGRQRRKRHVTSGERRGCCSQRVGLGKICQSAWRRVCAGCFCRAFRLIVLEQLGQPARRTA